MWQEQRKIYDTFSKLIHKPTVKMADIKITQEDSKIVLEKYFGDQAFNILKYSVELSPKDADYSHYLLKIQTQHIDEVRDLTFCAKSAPKHGETSVTFINTKQIFKKEVETYTKFFKTIEETLKNASLDFLPKFYANLNDNILILEDPTQDGAYKIPQCNQLDKEHIKVGLEALAKLHACSIAYEEKRCKTLEISYKLPDDFGPALEEVLFCEDKDLLGYKYMQSSLKAVSSIMDLMPENQELKQKLNDAFEDIYQSLSMSSTNQKVRKVFTHGDMWSNSTAFKYLDEKPISCKLLNFQYSRYAPPAFDVTEWICSANGDFVKKCYYELLEHYYTNLKLQLLGYGVEINKVLSIDQFETSCKTAMRFAKIMKATFYTVCGVNDEYFAKICQNSQDFNKFYYEDRSEYTVNCYKNDAEYRSTITQLIDNVIEDLRNDSLKIEDIYYIVQKDLGEKEFLLLDYKLTPFGCYLDNLKLEANIMLDDTSSKVLQYFVKKMPDISHVKEKSLFQNSFLKEHAWYRKMVPHFKTYSVDVESCLSKCYFSRLHDVIAFEDLSQQGYVALYHRFSLTFDKVLLAIKKMAAFHAKTIILEHKEKSESAEEALRYHTKFSEYFVESIYYMPEKACNTFTNAAKLGVLSLIDYFHDSQSKLSKEILKEQVLKIYDNIAEYLKPSKKYLNTTCHGDLSLHNLMFKLERNIPVDCAFVDFQSFRYAPPAHDLMSFLYLSTDREFRKIHMNRVIELYYDELREVLKSHSPDLPKILPEYAVFAESCKYYKLFAIAQSAIHFHYTMLTEDQLKAFYAVPGLNDKMFFEDRSEFVNNMCNSDPVYKEKLRQTIQDLQEFCGSSSAMKKISLERKQSKSELTFAPNVPFLAGRRYSQSQN